MASGGPDISVVVPFHEDEERIGALARRIAAHLRALGLPFELLFVDEDAGDNSVVLLLLLRGELPELRIMSAPRGHGFAMGAQAARGRALWFFDVAHASAPLAPFAWSHRRVAEGADVVWVKGRFCVARRARVWPLLTGLGGGGDAFVRGLVARARRKRLVVTEIPAREAPVWARLWGTLSRA